jgi:hypothetical protein
VAQRRSDVLGRQNTGGHLVEKRLKDVMIGLVDQDHASMGLLQLAGRRKPAEATSHDDDPGATAIPVGH